MPVNFTADPIHHNIPEGLEEQTAEWVERLYRDLFFAVQRHLPRLGSLPLPGWIDATATDGKLKMTIIVKFEREDS